MLNLARVTTDDVVYDLGSGDGRIVILAARKYGARGVGIEQDAPLVQIAREAARVDKVDDRATFIHGDLFTTSIADATVVTLYFSPSVNRMLEEKLRRELRPGTRIVSHQFGIGNWSPDRSIQVEGGAELFLWTVPRRPARMPDVASTSTPHAVAVDMLKLAGVRPGDVVYDLGSGDGRLVILAAQNYGAHGVGIELDPPLVDLSRQIAREGAVSDKATFIEGDLFTADISKASVVVLYLSADVNARLESKLRTELRPGARIVSRQFGIGSWAPDQSMRAEDGSELFLWTVPAK